MAADVFEHLDPVELGHEQVEQHDVRLDTGHHLNALQPILSPLYLEAVLGKFFLVGTGDDSVVLNDENFFHDRSGRMRRFCIC